MCKIKKQYSILITGGAGFVGSNTADRYIKEGHRVIIVDNLSTGKPEYLNPKAKFYLGDIRNKEFLTKLFELERPEIINHMAAQKSVPKSVENPLLDAEINILGLINLLQLSVKYRIIKFIFISTGGAIYGDTDTIPTPETVKPNLKSPYAITKYTSEIYIKYFHENYHLKYTILRPSNIYGPRQTPEGECGVIPIFLTNILNNKPSYLYAYSDMPRGTTRDYLYIDDVTKACVLALEKGDNLTINIATGIETYTEEVYNILLKISKKNLPLVKGGYRKGDVRRSVLDWSLAKSKLGWYPGTDLNTGLIRTYRHYNKG
jgi:UDP-glucose 4-epimerase